MTASVDPPVDGPEDHPAVLFDGEELRADKQFVAGTHRAMPPEETLARIRPHLAKGAITRVADITDLDTIGLPVAVAMRPASGTLAVEGGKGATFAAAMTSAAMEAIERYVAETAEVDAEWATPEEMAGRLAVAPEDFPMFRHAAIGAGTRYSWTWMRDLVDDSVRWVPTDLVILPTGEPRGVLAHPWAVGSNGLASGNHLLEAICAGLYEVIERDATSCWQAAQKRGDAPGLVVDQSTIDGPTLRGILDLLDRAGVDAVITWCPTEIGVPTALAHVVDRRRGTGVYKGYGCHLDPEIAMIRAVTEAIQSRTIFVAGARDDLLRPTYEAMKRSDVISAEAFVGEPVAVSARDMPDLSTRSFHGDVGTLVSMLRAAGFEHVLVRALESAQFEVAVTRVLVPGLEPYQFAWVATGARAQRFDPWAHVPR